MATKTGTRPVGLITLLVVAIVGMAAFVRLAPSGGGSWLLDGQDDKRGVTYHATLTVPGEWQITYTLPSGQAVPNIVNVSKTELPREWRAGPYVYKQGTSLLLRVFASNPRPLDAPGLYNTECRIMQGNTQISWGKTYNPSCSGVVL
jgi:hypothetical protein